MFNQLFTIISDIQVKYLNKLLDNLKKLNQKYLIMKEFKQVEEIEKKEIGGRSSLNFLI